MNSTLNENQPREQAGFRSGDSTIGNLQTIDQLVEKKKEYNKPLCLVVVRYAKKKPLIQ